MEEISRKEQSIKNSFAASFCYLLQIMMSFVARTFFIRLLNSDYLGINGLFANILTVLSLAELGVGTAIIYAMYTPVAQNNISKIAAYLNFYKILYRIIGIIVAVVGIAVLPFLPVLINNVPDIKENISIIYLLILSETVFSYFFSYKKSILILYQQNRIEQWINTFCILLRYLAQILILVTTKNIYLYYFVQTVFTVLSNFIASIIVDKRYPEIITKKYVLLDKTEKRSLFKNVLAMSASKIGSVAVNGTDNILISMFLSTSLVGIYSNYVYIINYIKSFVAKGFAAITSSVGNLVSSAEDDKVYEIFKLTYYTSYTFAFFITGILVSVLNTFIVIWAGSDYLLSLSITLLLVGNFFLGMIRQATEIFIDAYGLFWQLKYKPLFEAGINLFVSVVLAKYTVLGLTGIIIGTLVSNVFTNIWWEPYVLYKYGIHKNVATYFKRLGLDTLVCVGNSLVILGITNQIEEKSIINFILRGVISVIISIFIYVLVYWRCKEFKQIGKIIKNIIKK
nr:hypothetical protein [uncultured Blautia sp.]